MKNRPLAPAEIEGSMTAHNLEHYRFKDVPPRFVTNPDGYVELYVTPLSLQSEIMIEANQITADRYANRLEGRNDQGQRDRTLEPLGPLETLTLTGRLRRIGNINTRLRGRAPYDPQELKAAKRTPSQSLGKISLRRKLMELGWQTAPQQPIPYLAETHLEEGDVRLVMENLKKVGTDLRRQAQSAIFAAARSGYELDRTGSKGMEHKHVEDQNAAERLKGRASDMLGVLNQIDRQLPPALGHAGLLDYQPPTQEQ